MLLVLEVEEACLAVGQLCEAEKADKRAGIPEEYRCPLVQGTLKRRSAKGGRVAIYLMLDGEQISQEHGLFTWKSDDEDGQSFHHRP